MDGTYLGRWACMYSIMIVTDAVCGLQAGGNSPGTGNLSAPRVCKGNVVACIMCAW
jgi:hypothetical protein